MQQSTTIKPDTQKTDPKERAKRILKALSDSQVRIKLKTIANMRTNIRGHQRATEKLHWANIQIWAQVAQKYGLQPMDEFIMLESIDNPQTLVELKKTSK